MNMNTNAGVGTLHLIAIAAGVLLVAVVAGIWWFGSEEDSESRRDGAVMQTVSPEDLDIAFRYQSGNEGYTLIEPPLEGVAGGMLIDAFILMERTAYQTYQDAEPGTTAPPGINLFVFAAPEVETATSTSERPDRMTRLRQWASENDQLSSRSLAVGEPTEVEVDGLPMLHYTAEGTYTQDLYLGLYRDRVYLIVGQYESADDPIYTDFAEFIAGISFR